ncbi:DUF3427 domain-containing protein [Auritidibacter ignavus]|nr:DUF3427 domain-containing protein [Auritidibacter ignavus]
MPLPLGAYEALLTHRRQSQLDQRLADGTVEASIRPVATGEENSQLAQYLSGLIQRALEHCDTTKKRLALAERVIGVLGDEFAADQLLPAPESKPRAQQLLDLVSAELSDHSTTHRVSDNSAYRLVRPETPLSEAGLLTHSREGEPQIGAEIRSELDTADRVDLLMSFVKWSGLRLFEAELTRLKNRGATFRVLTTTYIGASERVAIDRLVKKFGAEVRISYQTTSTRLHAKAWLFHRYSGFSTAYVGSSNLSRAAMLDGLEWNVRLSQIATPAVMDKFQATFETFWASAEFEPYDPERDGDRLERALVENRHDGPSVTMTVGDDVVTDISGLEVRPYPHQVIMLEQLAAERAEHGRNKNLVVAATGTGKTVVAGLDYRNLAQTPDPQNPWRHDPPRLLFVAHRQEILRQSRRTFQEILADGSFGELLVDGASPRTWNHVFASVQSLHDEVITRIDPEHFDVIIIDEFHHAQAPTYRRLLNYFQPRQLLGLTATPERADGVNVAAFFDHRIATEMRLWDALESDILVPFHYFGIADLDELDLSRLRWTRGHYDETELSNLYTGNDARVRLVVKALRDKLTDLSHMKALGFCVDVQHAEFMATRFNQIGIAAQAITGGTPSDKRRLYVEQLTTGVLKMIFTVDVFNEGVDIPEVNTVVFLRPTESPVIFLQQLGRGLRRGPEKNVLTVLDLIGQQHEKFRMDRKFRALTGSGRRRLVKDVEHGFPYLPAGTQIVLDQIASDRILDNLKKNTSSTKNAVIQDVREHLGTRNIWRYTLHHYLTEADRTIEDIYRSAGSKRSWTSIRAEVAGDDAPVTDEGLTTSFGAFRLLHVNDEQRVKIYRELIHEPFRYEALTEPEQRWARMFYFSFLHPYQKDDTFASYDHAFDWLRHQKILVDEIEQIFEHNLATARIVPATTALGEQVPLVARASYRREEILAALDVSSWEKPRASHVEGVQYSEAFETDALLINLHKSERDFSPTTMYRDYAISPELFHWESQSRVGPDSRAGKRYKCKAENGTHTMLFARHSPTDVIGTRAFVCLGTADLVSCEGAKPMTIIWRLHQPMSQELTNMASAVAS